MKPITPQRVPPASMQALPLRGQLLGQPKLVRHHRIRWTVLSVSALVLVVLVTGGWLAYRAISVINTKKLDGSKLSFFQQLTHIVTSTDQQLQGESDDRVNILLLGYGGAGHDGPYLTDTMMLVSFQPSTKKVALISIPRDLYVNIPGYGYRKINEIMSDGRDQKYPGGGEAMTVKVVSDLLNTPIQYYASIDFNGFKQVIDQVGGVTVTVDRTFYDAMYPDSGIGYDPVSFKAGTQTMNGTTALKFARSRHGNNGEGTDFARAARQQKIILALKDKLLSFGTLSNPKKISDILGSLGTHSQTNMEVWEMLRLGKLAGGMKSDNIINRVIDDSTNGLVKAATGYGGAFILIPRDGTYQDIQFMVRNVFAEATAEQEHATIAVVNASGVSGLGASVAAELRQLKLTVVKSSTFTQTVGQTVIVSAQPGKFPITEQFVNLYRHGAGVLSLSSWQSQTGDTTLQTIMTTPITVSQTTSSIVNGNTITTNTTSGTLPDIIVVLGQDQPKAGASVLPAFLSGSTSTTSTTNSNTNTKSTATNANANTNTKTTNTNTKTANTNTKTTNTNTSSAKNTNSASINSNTNL